jgi:alkanesulfonate monooxygenase SsuD/methylene tetrahydromethanopterin reductase-like flavin-dependent oxidoreductase (luciferase family)
VRIVPEGQVAFGMQLPIQAQSHLFAEGWEASAGVAEMVDLARIADHSGFCYLAVCDHAAIPKDRAGAMTTTWWDCMSTLSYLAAVTTQVRLLSHVYALPLAHPLRVAKQWTTLDSLSGGRAILGVGAGNIEGEFAALGVDFARRGELLDEAYREMGITPRPVQDRIPIWVGGSSRAAIQRSAERGDGWLPERAPEGGMSAAIALIRSLRERAGRADEPFTIGALSGPLYVGEPTWDIGRAVTGSPEQVAGFLRVLAGLGVNQIQVAFRSRDAHELYDQIRVFGAEVAPLVQP